MRPRTPPFFSVLRSSIRPIPYTCKELRQPHRAASFYSRRGSGYNRITRGPSIGYRWRNSPNFRYGVVALGAGGVGAFIYNLERVPVTGRLRFNCIPEWWELKEAQAAYEAVLQQYGRQILPSNHPDSIVVNRVMRRLIPASGLGSEGWEVRVIEDREMKNAFVLPGGKVFVFSGILPICKDEEGLAAVLGHEIAHNVLHHAAEKSSGSSLLIAAILAVSTFFAIDFKLTSIFFEYMVFRPGSRVMESEADQVGLDMMARSCYDPQKAVSFWQRMVKAESFAPPQWASTHPSSQNRILAIQNWIPAAQDARASSGCSGISGYVDDFAKAFQQDPSARGIPPRRPVAIQSGKRDGDDDDYFF